MMVTFHQGLHSLLKQNLPSGKEIQHFWGNITFDPSIYIMDHPDLNVSNFMENSKGLIMRQSKVACGF